mmetsp:Transcript_23829/g.57457  ORF Transcript_23829/g.57457 Transcript_23829/m.57457 type:complete len:211 (+) Transcript_23829:1197-1829(+)
MSRFLCPYHTAEIWAAETMLCSRSTPLPPKRRTRENTLTIPGTSRTARATRRGRHPSSYPSSYAPKSHPRVPPPVRCRPRECPRSSSPCRSRDQRPRTVSSFRRGRFVPPSASGPAIRSSPPERSSAPRSCHDPHPPPPPLRDVVSNRAPTDRHIPPAPAIRRRERPRERHLTGNLPSRQEMACPGGALSRSPPPRASPSRRVRRPRSDR